MKTLNPIRFALLAAAALFTHAAFAAGGTKPPTPTPSSGTLVLSLPNAFNWGLAAAPSGTIFAVGNNHPAGIAGGNQLVLSSTDHGNSWSVLDDFAPPGRSVDFFGVFELGGGIASDPHWIVRKSTNGGTSWTTVDDYQLSADNSSQARCIASDASGNLVVAGSGAGKWIIRKSAGGTGPWTTMDVFQNGGAVTTPNAITPNAFGNIFIGGNDGVNWLIKRY